MNRKATYPIVIREGHLDTFGHVNNATYLEILEEARWELLTQNGYGLKQVQESRKGPVILEINIQFRKELVSRQEILVESEMISYPKKIAKMRQRIVDKEGNIYCIAEVTFGLFDLLSRKLIEPTPEWRKGIGLDE